MCNITDDSVEVPFLHAFSFCLFLKQTIMEYALVYYFTFITSFQILCCGTGRKSATRPFTKVCDVYRFGNFERAHFGRRAFVTKNAHFQNV